MIEMESNQDSIVFCESNSWSNENDECLIDFVRRNEALYNVKSKGYRKIKLKKMLWLQIGDVLNKPGSDCQKRWFCVRDYYVRRRGKAPATAGGELFKRRCDLLSFLDNVPSTQRGSTSSFAGDSSPDHEPQNSIEYPSEDPLNSYGEVKKFGKKRKCKINQGKRQLLKQARSSSDDDENDLFFKSMAKIVKKLPQYDQAQLRVRIGSLVGNAEIQCFSKSTCGEDQNYFGM